MEKKIEEWLTVSNGLKALKEKELKLRREVALEMAKGSTGEFKVHAEYELFDIQAEFKMNRKVDAITIHAMFEGLNDHEKACIKFDPKLNLSQYRKLPDDSMLHEAVTETPSPTPVLKVTMKI